MLIAVLGGNPMSLALIMKIGLALLTLAVLILVHEIGHYVVARRIGIPVYEFSIGFGKLLWSRTNKDGVQFSLRLIPLGGYVKLAGEEPGDTEVPDGYSNRTPLEKMAVSFAGPFMNFVFAALLFIVTYAIVGVSYPATEPVIGMTMPGKPAAVAGITTGDKILSINDKVIMDWTDLVATISSQPVGSTLKLNVERDGQALVINVNTTKNDVNGKSIIGVQPKIIFVREDLLKSISMGFQQTYKMTALMFEGFRMLFSGAVPVSELSGPVGITNMIGEAYESGWDSLFMFAGFLSVNLGIMNLLPIPALDGSRIVFAIIEAIRRKPLDPEKEGLVHMIGFFFLIGLMIFATYNDVIRLLKG